VPRDLCETQRLVPQVLNKPRRTSLFICLVAILLLLVAGLMWVHGKTPSQQVALPVEPAFPVPSGRHNSYTTSFAATEQPISERGKWISGKITGGDWADVRTSVGLAYGTEFGTREGDEAYDDSTALLTGTWGADQTAEAEVRSVRPSDRDFEEVELRLRSSLSSHNATGYEVLFRCSKAADAYAAIARWDGRLGRFAYLSQKQGPEYGVTNGDIVKATAVGGVIIGYINGVEMIRATDNTYADGSPGMGFWFKKSSSRKFWLSKTGGVNTDCGFRRFAAWD
jgi:hypothetical protein